MPNILIDGTIALPADMHWEDEFSWSPTSMKADRSITGSFIVQVGTKVGGRRITLRAGDDTAWVTREVLDRLKSLQRDLSAPVFTLVMADGRGYNVAFDETSGPAITAVAKQPGKAPEATDYFVVTLTFMEIKPV